jgi:hypothetical protein
MTTTETTVRNLIEANDYVFAPTWGKNGKVESVDHNAGTALVIFGWGDTNKWEVPVVDIIREDHPRKGSRHDSFTRLTGNPMLVLAEVKRRLDNDHPTQCYEHMALKVHKLELADYPETITVELYQNGYAGD